MSKVSTLSDQKLRIFETLAFSHRNSLRLHIKSRVLWNKVIGLKNILKWVRDLSVFEKLKGCRSQPCNCSIRRKFFWLSFSLRSAWFFIIRNGTVIDNKHDNSSLPRKKNERRSGELENVWECSIKESFGFKPAKRVQHLPAVFVSVYCLVSLDGLLKHLSTDLRIWFYSGRDCGNQSAIFLVPELKDN